MTSAVLLLSCPDRRGIVAAVAKFVADHGGNVLHADQHTDQSAGVFFQRVEFDLDTFGLERAAIAPAFEPLADEFAMTSALRFSDDLIPTAILASRHPHCLNDLLMRWRSGELACDLRVVIANHPDHAELCDALGVPFVHLPITPDTKPAQERTLLDRLHDDDIELVVLARYMQILSPGFVARWQNRIINIHHSFLPAFAGASPYGQAYGRGVKLIGATAHYVTSELDAGPIIEQDVHRVDHRDTVDDLRRIGRQTERAVLARAVAWHVEDRILVHGNKTIVFS